MKRSFIALFFVFLLSVSAFQSAVAKGHSKQANTRGRCRWANGFTDYLQKEGVKFLYRAHPVSNHCGTEWRDHGSCCEADSVRAFYEQEKKNMNDLIQQSTQRVGIIEEIGYSYYTTMHTGIDILKKRFLNSTLPEKDRIFYSNQMQQFQYENNRLTQRALYWMRKHMRKMVSDQRKCLNKLLQVRSSSVCYACSRRGKYFFTKNMLNVNINQCRDVISECSHSWLYLLQFLDRGNTFLRESQRLQRWIGVDFEKALPNGRTTSVLNWAQEAKWSAS